MTTEWIRNASNRFLEWFYANLFLNVSLGMDLGYNAHIYFFLILGVYRTDSLSRRTVYEASKGIAINLCKTATL